MYVDNKRIRWALVLAFTIFAAATIACGGGDDGEESGSEPTATTQASSGSPSGTSTTGTASPTSPSGFNFPGLNTGSGAGDNPCAAINAAAGIPGTLLSSFATSSAPDSEFSEQASSFFEELLESALSLEAEATCFFSLSLDESAGLWMAFALSESIGADAASLLTQALQEQGVSTDDSGAFTANFGEGQFTGIGITSLPGISVETGGLLYIAGNTAVVAVGTTFSEPASSGGGSLDPTSTPGSGGASGSSIGPGSPVPPSPTPIITFGGDLTGKPAEVESALRAALEDALGVSLELTSTFTSGLGDTTSLLATYLSTPDLGSGNSEALSSVVTGFGGTVDFSLQAGEGATLSFSGAYIGDSIVGGTLAIGGSSVTLSAQITAG